MKAVIASGYGGPEVLSVQEVSKPKPKSNEVLIKVRAASVNSADVRIRVLDAGDGLKGLVSKIIIRLLVGVTTLQLSSWGSNVRLNPSRVPSGVQMWFFLCFLIIWLRSSCSFPSWNATASKSV